MSTQLVPPPPVRPAPFTPVDAVPATVGMLDAVRAVRRRLRLLLLVGCGTAVLTTIAVLLVRNRYMANVELSVESNSPMNLSALGGLASLGAPLLGRLSGGGESPAFYADVIKTRRLQYALLEHRFAVPPYQREKLGRDSAALLDILAPKGDTPEERLWYGARMLGAATGVSTDPKTSVLRMSIETRSPQLSAAVATQYVTELARFARETRQSQARLKREFLQERVREAQRELASAEETLKGFLLGNRSYTSSPALQYEYSRLQRNVTTREELYLGLRRQLDMAQLSELDVTSVFTVVQPAVVPQQKSGPMRSLIIVAVSGFVTVVTALGLVLYEFRYRLFPGLRTTDAT